MSARNGADPLAPRIALRDNRDLHLRRPFSPLARACENLEPLRTSAHRIITRDYHSSSASPPVQGAETRRYASNPQGGAGTALTVVRALAGVDRAPLQRLGMVFEHGTSLFRASVSASVRVRAKARDTRRLIGRRFSRSARDNAQENVGVGGEEGSSLVRARKRSPPHPPLRGYPQAVQKLVIFVDTGTVMTTMTTELRLPFRLLE